MSSAPAVSPKPPAPSGAPAAFTVGSTMRHVVVMTATGSIGLIAIFVVDFLNLFYISQLGQQELAAAIGYAGTLLFFLISVAIGLAIAATALVSRALGAGARPRARRLAASSVVLAMGVMALVTAGLMPFIRPITASLGATGVTLDIAVGFLHIVMPTTPLMAGGMVFASILRAVGDAKRAMYVTLIGGFVAAIADPLLIFGFDLGVTGAAIATVCSRLAIFVVGFHGASVVHDLVARPDFKAMLADAMPLGAIALPAVLTNVATPVGNAYVTMALAPYGDGAVAGWAVIGRLIPVVFGALFALSGAIGPILGQNLGARRFDRVRQAMVDALVFITIYSLIAWAGLFLMRDWIVAVFDMTGPSAELVRFFAVFVAGSFLFNGFMFVANAAFNNLGFPTLSTAFNWGKATLGTIPFVWIGGHYAGAEGVLVGQGIGAVLFGVAAVWSCFVVLRRLNARDAPVAATPLWKAPQHAFTSEKDASSD